MKPTLTMLRQCKRCGRQFPPWHFRPGRRSCRSCLEGLPTPAEEETYLVVRRPRPSRRKWPSFVLAHEPTMLAKGPCAWCGKRFKRKRRNQRFCSPACRVQANRAKPPHPGV